MLWWSGAAAVPILIHLFARRRYQRVAWAAMEFLNLAFKKTKKRVQLENLLLLILRVLVLLLLALALAEPRFASAGLFGRRSVAETDFFLIDSSFSMDLRDATGEQSPYSRARKKALEVLGKLDRERDAAALITLGAPAHIEVPPSREITKIASDIERIQVSQGGTDILGGLRLVSARLEEPTFAKEFPGRRVVYVFTDMQRSAFVADTAQKTDEEGQTATKGDQPNPAFESALRALKDLGAEVVFVDCGLSNDRRPANVAVTSLVHSGQALVRGAKTSFECRIRNFGDKTVSGEVQFFVDQEQSFVRSERISALKGLATGTRAETEASFTFEHEFAEAGRHHVAVKFIDDGLRTDNTRRFAFEVRDHLRVLCVNGWNGRDREDSATFFVARAFDPELSRTVTQKSVFQAREIGVTEVQNEDFKDFDIICLADVVQLSPAKAKELEEFTDAGGSLIFIPGKNVENDAAAQGVVNTAFFRSGQGLLPLPYGRAVGSEDLAAEAYFLQFPSVLHPSMRYFKDPRVQAILTQAPIRKFLETPPGPPPAGVATLFSFRRGTATAEERVYAAALAKTVGKGTVVQFTTATDKKWNEFGASGFLVPLLREIGFWLTRPKDSLNAVVGEAHVERFDPSITKVSVTEGKEPAVERTVNMAATKTVGELPFSRLERAEIITMRPVFAGAPPKDPAIAAERRLAVNVDAAESDLERMEPAAITAAFGTDLLRMAGAADDLSAGAEDKAAAGFWKPFLYAMLAALIFESFFARRFTPKDAAGGAA